MMEPTDITIDILTSIRDEIRSTRDEIRTTRTELSTRIDETNTRLDRVERRQVESEMRIATELVAIAGVMHDLRDDLRHDRALRERVDDHERRIERIESRRG